MKDINKKGLYTKAIHGGQEDGDCFGSASFPIYQTSTFVFENTEQGANRFAGTEDGYIYTRIGNPTTKALEDNIALLEGAFGGLATATGMAAISTLYFALLSPNTHIVSTDAVYGPSRLIIEKEFSRFGVEFSFIDSTNIENVRKAIKPNTELLYIETPANPTMGITDIKECAKIAHEHNIPLAVDNTFCSPYLQRPIEFGADIVVHSLTKFINGHSDICGGMILTKDKEMFIRMKKVLTYLGGTMDPHQSWLALRGVKTLPLRIEKAQEIAFELAQYLESHPKIEWIKYPGLKSHPQYEIGKKQMDGFGSMISFGVKGGLEAGKKLLNNLHIPKLAVSLGGIESLIQHPASMTHAGMSKEERYKANITDELIRLSVGCENCKDLKDDLEHAMSLI